jgi:hypothetical protein
MKNLRSAGAALALASLMCGSALAQIFVGSYQVSNGPQWTTNPPVYSAQEAAALIFGGFASVYVISTNPNTTDPTTITHTGWYDGWGEPCTEQPENFKLDVAPPGYQFPGGLDTSWSAYVSDHGCSQTNYVWRLPPAGTPIPTLGEWALVALAAAVGLFGIVAVRRRVA